jgi:hypothetical protein
VECEVKRGRREEGGAVSIPLFRAVAFMFRPPCAPALPQGAWSFAAPSPDAVLEQPRPRRKTPKDLTPQATSLPLPPNRGFCFYEGGKNLLTQGRCYFYRSTHAPTSFTLYCGFFYAPSSFIPYSTLLLRPFVLHSYSNLYGAPTVLPVFSELAPLRLLFRTVTFFWASTVLPIFSEHAFTCNIGCRVPR